jgi:hypothetical protein
MIDAPPCAGEKDVAGEVQPSGVRAGRNADSGLVHDRVERAGAG